MIEIGDNLLLAVVYLAAIAVAGITAWRNRGN